MAYGADWPGQALHEGKVRANAVRRAAATVKNAWLGSELKQKSHPLHVLRLLFAVACDIDRVSPWRLRLATVEHLLRIDVHHCR